MSSDKRRKTPHIEVDDPAAAMAKAQELGRRLLAVPKKTIDEKLAKERSAKGNRKRRGQ